MPDDAHITNLDAQQGESLVRKGSHAPANINEKVQPHVASEDSIDEGAVPVPQHPGQTAKPDDHRHGSAQNVRIYSEPRGTVEFWNSHDQHGSDAPWTKEHA